MKRRRGGWASAPQQQQQQQQIQQQLRQQQHQRQEPPLAWSNSSFFSHQKLPRDPSTIDGAPPPRPAAPFNSFPASSRPPSAPFSPHRPNQHAPAPLPPGFRRPATAIAASHSPFFSSHSPGPNMPNRSHPSPQQQQHPHHVAAPPEPFGVPRRPPDPRKRQMSEPSTAADSAAIGSRTDGAAKRLAVSADRRGGGGGSAAGDRSHFHQHAVRQESGAGEDAGASAELKGSPAPLLVKSKLEGSPIWDVSRENQGESQFRIRFIEDTMGPFADITCPRISTTGFCISIQDVADHTTLDAMMKCASKLSDRYQSIVLFVQLPSPPAAFSAVAFQRLMQGLLRENGGCGWITILPVSSSRDLADTLVSLCSQGSEKLAVAQMVRQIDATLKNDTAKILSLLSGVTLRPLPREDCRRLQTSFTSIEGIARASRSDLERSGIAPPASLRVQQFFVEESL
ncbi:hypothetical protein DFJ73DRAFT_830822 [Zopfochytrium polystomum]|nr:hypothetical protein DFJ73DRAFT_830822 [Zopfochytrium polystomum]